jgi:hypothetical protein
MSDHNIIDLTSETSHPSSISSNQIFSSHSQLPALNSGTPTLQNNSSVPNSHLLSSNQRNSFITSNTYLLQPNLGPAGVHSTAGSTAGLLKQNQQQNSSYNSPRILNTQQYLQKISSQQSLPPNSAVMNNNNRVSNNQNFQQSGARVLPASVQMPQQQFQQFQNTQRPTNQPGFPPQMSNNNNNNPNNSAYYRNTANHQQILERNQSIRKFFISLLLFNYFTLSFSWISPTLSTNAKDQC